MKPKPIPGNGKVRYEDSMAMPLSCKLIAKRVQGGGANKWIETKIYLNMKYDGKRTYCDLWSEDEVIAECECKATETHRICIRRMLKSLADWRSILVLELVDEVQVWRSLR